MDVCWQALFQNYLLEINDTNATFYEVIQHDINIYVDYS